MKKILIVLGILLCTLTSCGSPECKEVDGRQVEIIDDTRSWAYTIKYVEFDEHEYTYFQKGHQGSFCHSPKCHCLNKYEK